MAPTTSFSLLPASPASARSLDHRDKDKGVNVQVLVRCRPLNEDELRFNAPAVLTCNDQRREVSVNLNVASKQIDRTFTFDKVFGPQAQQKDLYDQAIRPIVNEVLEGFNCTIFAYGQTGTGKTYTMEGDSRKAKTGEMPIDAGVIPRAVQQIVDTLESQRTEYSMKVTFLELYNEELTDLLAPSVASAEPDIVPSSFMSRSMSSPSLLQEQDKSRKPLTLMEDGKGSVLVRGLEEEVVYSADEIYNLLERGSAKRRTAETLLNKQSSRSHSIFSITIHIKEATPEGEELIKCGKLNLVDLAGSENISRSGARDGRAREAGEINKSLLTLGRVITALVEHLGHVPYRDSKLTRLLRDSLGGKTKTCIIATVSPSVHCLEETLSTLDYAHRAKNIKNKPEINQKMMKSALIKDLYGEIDKLRTELYAAREKNGVYLPQDRYLREEAERKSMSEKIELMQLELEAKTKHLEDMQGALSLERCQSADVTLKLESYQRKLEQTLQALASDREKLREAQYLVRERDFMISKIQQSENALMEQAKSLHSQFANSINDLVQLHSKVDRKNKLESHNLNVVHALHGELDQQLSALHNSVGVSIAQQQQQLNGMEESLRSYLATKNQMADQMKDKVSRLKEMFSARLKHLYDLACSYGEDANITFQKLNTSVSAHASAIEQLLLASVSEAEALLQDVLISLSKQQQEIASFTCQHQEVAEQSVNAARSFSKTLVEFYGLLQRNTTDMHKDTIDSYHGLQQNLTELEATFKENSKREDDMLIEKICELISAATARKTENVTSKLKAVHGMLSKKSGSFEQCVLGIQDATSIAENQTQAYIEQLERCYDTLSGTFASEQKHLCNTLDNCKIAATSAGQCWKSAQETIQHLGRTNECAIDVIIREATNGNAALLSDFERLNSSIHSDLHAGNSAVMESIDSSFQTDSDATTRILSMVTFQSQALADLQNCHKAGTEEIQSRTNRCLNDEYLEDKPTCTTPRKCAIDVPCRDSIEALRAPSMDDLAQEFRESNSPPPPTTANSSLEHSHLDSHRAALKETKVFKDNRVPLTTVN